MEKKYTESNTKPDTENNIEPVTKIVNKKKNTKPDTKLDKDLATVCSCHVTYAFQSESTLYSCLNAKELLARSRREI